MKKYIITILLLFIISFSLFAVTEEGKNAYELTRTALAIYSSTSIRNNYGNIRYEFSSGNYMRSHYYLRPSWNGPFFAEYIRKLEDAGVKVYLRGNPTLINQSASVYLDAYEIEDSSWIDVHANIYIFCEPTYSTRLKASLAQQIGGILSVSGSFSSFSDGLILR